VAHAVSQETGARVDVVAAGDLWAYFLTFVAPLECLASLLRLSFGLRRALHPSRVPGLYQCRADQVTLEVCQAAEQVSITPVRRREVPRHGR
jgi:hypothetical protein